MWAGIAVHSRLMSDVSKKIAGDWFDVRQIMDSPVEYDEFFAFSDGELSTLKEELRLCVDAGTVELKRTMLARIDAFLDSHSFESRTFSDIAKHTHATWIGIYVSLLQRASVLGTVALRRESPAQQAQGGEPPQIELKEIAAAIQAKIAKDPELRKHPAVKNILMQVSYYRREVDNMKELAPNIPKEKAPAFYDNFKRTFADITRKAQESYIALLREESRPAAPVPANILDRYDLSPLAPTFAAQAQEFARLHSILAYAEKERYKTREILEPIGANRSKSLSIVERELKEYERVAFSRGTLIAREFSAALADYFERRLSRR